MEKSFALVAVNLPLDKTFSYNIPERLRELAEIGRRVLVPFQNRKIVGYLVGFEDSPSVEDLKEIIDILDEEPLFHEKDLSFFQWISQYYFAPIGQVISHVLPKKVQSSKFKVQSSKLEAQSSKLEARSSKLKVENSKLKTQNSKLITLTPRQAGCFEVIKARIQNKVFYPFLLHGVTGSGKTEVYIKAIEESLKMGRSAIMMVPEISLTPKVIDRFRSYFGDNVAVLHSRLTEKEWYEEWLRIKKGMVQIAVGARSVIFAPFQELGIIIADEEHDTSYKQEERIIYNARDVALVKGKIYNCVVILGSATPSIESYFNAQTKKFHYLSLPIRVGKSSLSPMEVVDLRKEGRLPFSSKLLKAIKTTLNKGEQTILFLNRRGFAAFILCKSCGFTFKCPNCSVTLTYHRSEKKLLCHYCNYSKSAPELCPKCGGLKMQALGLGTEKVEEAVRRLFSQAKVGRMDKDTTTHKDSYRKILEEFERGDIEVLIGTQMITKGHDYPKVTLVGVICADTSLHFPDFRSGERTFQLLTQVAGRAGRGEKEGKVIIQTFSPDSYCLRLAHGQDYKNFYQKEMTFRKELEYPPFTRLISFRLAGNSHQITTERALFLGEKAKQLLAEKEAFMESIQILGPSPSPLKKLKGKYRWQMILKGKDNHLLHSFAQKIFHEVEVQGKGVKLTIDVDPINML